MAGDEAQERELARDGEDGRRQGQGAHHVERGQCRIHVADQVIAFLLSTSIQIFFIREHSPLRRCITEPLKVTV